LPEIFKDTKKLETLGACWRQHRPSSKLARWARFGLKK